DRGERRETVVPVVVAVHQPVTARGRLEQHVVRHDDVWRRGGRARARPLPHQGPGHQARQRDGTPPSGPLPHTHLPYASETASHATRAPLARGAEGQPDV